MRLLFLFIFISNCYFSYCQVNKPKHCASHYWDSLQLAANPEYAAKRTSFENELSTYIDRKKKSSPDNSIYQIPVVVHIIHNNSNGTIGGTNNSNISQAQILSQIEVLNEDFRRTNSDTTQTPDIFKGVAADAEISFCLASIDPSGNTTGGITRTFSNNLPYNPLSNSDNIALKSLSYWPANQYMNIWVTELNNNILGYATFPSDVNISGLSNYFTPLKNDGIVIDHRVFGKEIGTVTNSLYNLGRTTTHEVGHWLGLFHTWGDGDNCFATDYCTDTPDEFSASNGCPENPFSCSSQDMIENYMDYSYDECMNIFTIDQKDRMRSVIELSERRNSLLNSLGCCLFSKKTLLPFTENFENGLDTVNLWTTYTNNYSIVTDPAIDNYSFSFTSNNSVDTSFLITPIMNFTELSTPFLAFQTYSSESLNNLTISYSLTCTEKWTNLTTYNSTNKSTWNIHNINLEEIQTLQAARLRFEYLPTNTVPLYIDNINIHGENNTTETIVYPNPSKGAFLIEFNHGGLQNKKVEVYSTLGTSLATFYLGDSYSSTQNIDFSNFASGLYILKIYVGEDVSTKKVTLSK